MSSQNTGHRSGTFRNKTKLRGRKRDDNRSFNSLFVKTVIQRSGGEYCGGYLPSREDLPLFTDNEANN